MARLPSTAPDEIGVTVPSAPTSSTFATSCRFDFVDDAKKDGGLNNPRGCVIGGFALGVLESMVNLWQAQWRDVAIFVLVILVLAFRPTGLFGGKLVEKV